MRLNLASILIIALQSCTAAPDDTQTEFQPDRVPYNVLVSAPNEGPTELRETLLDALSTEGLVSITDIPDFTPLKRSLMKWLHSCIMDQGSNADNVLEVMQKDGTIRRSFASVTVPGPGGDQDFTLTTEEGKSLSPSCQEFSNNLKEFRSHVSDATEMFSKRLHAEMGSFYNMPLMDTEDGSQSFHTIEDIVSSGEHLEHFHSYQKIHQSPSLLRSEKDETIELHTDQGFFIAFAPGLMVSHVENKPDIDTPLWETDGFFIEKQDGTRAHVKFDSQDDLIFMMGDGVNQYINPKIKDHSSAQMRTLRATPHSVTLPAHDKNLSRVWYGRMVLPPNDAHSEKDGKSYGTIRSLFSSSEVAPGGLGCSSKDEIRALAAGSDGHGDPNKACEEGTLWCWVRCMELEMHGAHQCEEQNLLTQCINPRDQFSTGDNHGDYYPGCSNTTVEQGPYDPLDNYPQNETICTTSEWVDFSNADEYDHYADLSEPIKNARLMWSVKDEKIHGRLAYNGLHGYLSIGFANLAEDAGHNGMNGANILMSIPGDNYDAKTGFDFSVSGSVGEYVIHPKASSFRHWKDPVTDSTSSIVSTLHEHDCFTSITFEADGINGQEFNTMGTDIMIWGANGKDKFAGYHGRTDRDKFSVEWSTGKVEIIKPPPRDDPNSGVMLSTALAIVFGLFSTLAFM